MQCIPNVYTIVHIVVQSVSWVYTKLVWVIARLEPMIVEEFAWNHFIGAERHSMKNVAVKFWTQAKWSYCYATWLTLVTICDSLWLQWLWLQVSDSQWLSVTPSTDRLSMSGQLVRLILISDGDLCGSVNIISVLAHFAFWTVVQTLDSKLEPPMACLKANAIVPKIKKFSLSGSVGRLDAHMIH